MVDTETARTIVGIVGNVISFGLFLSPIPTFITIWKKKTASGFKPDPYVATVLNCAMWVFYGMPFVHPDSLLVVTINGFGFCLELVYVGIFFIYSPWKRRRNILLALLVELIFMAAVVAITLLVLHTTGRRSTLVGILCIIFNIAMYTSPLTIMVLTAPSHPDKERQVHALLLSLANFLNGVIWAVYALLKFDPFVLVPNGLGALSGLVQLILYATYYRTTKWDEPEKPMSEVEISGA